MNNAFIARRIIQHTTNIILLTWGSFSKLSHLHFLPQFRYRYNKIDVQQNYCNLKYINSSNGFKMILSIQISSYILTLINIFCWQRGVFVFVFFVQGSQVMLCSTWYFRVYRVPIFRGYQELNNNICMMCICGLYWCGSYNSC